MMESRETETSEEIQKDRASDHSASEPVNGDMVDWNSLTSEESEISRESTMFDIDRMINEGLGGGNVTMDNGLIGSSTTDTMEVVDESPREPEEGGS
ncbi:MULTISPECIES: hypothetical protein [Paenibacillus]|uniref:hypothetical protein n=1 Tax=Paenibacillus TaxID=44249 RepID=UPI001B1FE029|nr:MULTISPECIES: hypothetical protein [Paenibacillus]WFB57667.1 hypothetical protein P0X86_27485 [Paenibacillus sp. BR1-192]GIP05276.1 hypothetical protein J28TS4_36830 [Paenibacillus lautus]